MNRDCLAGQLESFACTYYYQFDSNSSYKLITTNNASNFELKIVPDDEIEYIMT